MKKPKTGKFFTNVKTSLAKHSPGILIGIGVVGMVTSTILAVRATPKAIELLEEEKARQNYEICKEARDRGLDTCEEIEHLKPLDAVKTTWKCYLPAAVIGVTSIACIIGGNSVNTRRNAALGAAYKISETALAEYREKVIETIGERKEREVREKVGKERLDKHPITPGTEIIYTDKGNTLFLEPLSGRYFYSDVDHINRVVNELNARMYHGIGGYVSLNEFYDEINVPELSHTSIGDDIGWNVNGGTGLIDIDFSAHRASNDKPCFVLDYLVEPRYGYMYA